MSAPWPASLPTCVQGWDETNVTESVYIDSTVQSGPKKRRRRFTGSIREIAVSMRIDHAMFVDMTTFYENTLDYGLIPLVFTHPYTGVDAEFEMVSPPVKSSSGRMKVIVSMVWRQYIP